MKKLTNYFCKVVSFVLAVAILAQIPPFGIFSGLFKAKAETADLTEELPITSTENVLESETYEVVEMRTSNEKYLRLPDGSYTVVKYAHDVHYLKDGAYKEYDNTLVQVNNTKGQAVWVPKDSDANIAFAKNTTGNLFTVGDEQFSISVSLCADSRLETSNETLQTKNLQAVASVQAVIGTKNMSETVTDKVAQITTLDKVTADIGYSNILPNTTLNYTLYGNNIKESIVLNSASATTSWSFSLSVSGASAQIDDNGDIIFRSTADNEIVCIIPHGYMFDSAGNHSNDVTYTLAQTTAGYTLGITADSAWINDTDRVFPVTIDPTFIMSGYSADELSDSYVVEAQPSVHCGDYEIMLAGNAKYDSNLSKMRGLIKINNLPELPVSARVVDATLNLQQLEGNKWYSFESSDVSYMNLVAKKVTSAWAENTVCWNNQPTYDSTVLDYITVATGTATKVFHFDVTSAVQDWYKNPSTNYGIVLMSSAEEVDGKVGFISADNPHGYSATLPIYTISYRDTRGLDDRWAYSSQSAGNAGNGYVNLWNGNLVFVHENDTTSGSILPITVSHVYNGYQKGLPFVSNSSNINAPTTTGNFANVGYGWKLSVSETIVQKTISGVNWLVYNDPDGTELYFADYPDGTTGNYLSEDGYALTITIDSTSADKRYSMKDDYGNTKSFNSDGNITFIEDTVGNKKEFTYSDGRLRLIYYYPAGTDHRIVQFSFGYNQQGALAKITNVERNRSNIQFYYSTTYNGDISNENNGYLRRIQHSTGEYMQYDYDATGLLVYAQDLDTNTCIKYDYSGNVVSAANEYAPSLGWGQKVYFNYKDKETTVRNTGRDDISGNSDDINNVYLFDNYGRTVCAYATNLDGSETYGASVAEYTDTSADNPRKNNKIEKVATAGGYAENLVLNSSFENTGSWSGLTYPFFRCSAYYMGNSAVSCISGLPQTDNFYQDISITESGTYTLSCYVKTENVVCNEGGGVYIALVTETETFESVKLKGTTSTAIQNGWQRISVSAELTAGSTVRVLCGVRVTGGNIYFDCVQLEKGDAPSNYNLISKGSVEQFDLWTCGGTAGTYSSNLGVNGSQCIYTAGAPDKVGYAYQTVNINRPASETSFVLSGWAKANSVAAKDDDIFSGNSAYTHEERFAALRAVIYYTDGTTETQYAKFNANIRGGLWQYTSGAIVPAESNLTKTIQKVEVGTYYAYNANTTYFDNISFTVEPACIYTYDNEGKLTKLSAEDGTAESLAYSGADLVSVETKTDDEYTYTYYTDANGNSNHQVKDITSKSGVKATYTYDVYGNVSGTTITPKTGNLVISSSSVSSYYGNFPSAETDSMGNTTTYSYKVGTGLLQYIEYANSSRTAYIYDAARRLTNVFGDTNKDGIFDSTESGIQYVYNAKNNLTQIITATTEYNFVYDNFGNMLSVTIGDNTTPLVSYEYASGNGKLIKTTYADGTIITNTYDELDRIEAVSYNGVVAYTTSYNANGNLGSYYEVANGRTHSYEYDGIGRLIRYYVTDESGIVLSSENVYGTKGYITSTNTSINNGQMTNSQSVVRNDSGLPVSYSQSGLPTVWYYYDEFDRISEKREVSTDENGTDSNLFSEHYGYWTSGNNTSTLVNTYTTKYADTDLATYTYTYDSVGNITKETGGRFTSEYQYDELNRLSVETKYVSYGRGWQTVYSYDNNGNILQKTQYNYRNNAVTDVIQSDISYGYTNSNWGDLLTSYDGHDITYDANGNPLSYCNGESYTFTWDKGRRLASAVVGDTTVSYTYDVNGMRTSKLINDVH